MRVRYIRPELVALMLIAYIFAISARAQSSVRQPLVAAPEVAAPPPSSRLLTTEQTQFGSVMEVLRDAVASAKAQAPAGARAARSLLDDQLTARIVLVFHDVPDSRRVATSLVGAMPLAIESMLLPCSPGPTDTNVVAAVVRAAGLTGDDAGLAVVLLARHDATVWVAASTGDVAHFASDCLAMAAMSTGMSASLPSELAFKSTREIDGSVMLTAIPSGTTSDLRRVLATTDLPVVVTFWADWCKPCLNEMPALQGLNVRYAGKVRFVGLANARAQNPNLARVIEDRGLTFQNYAFIEQSLYTDVFNCSMTLPALAVFDRSRRLVHVVHGAATEPAAMEGLVARLDLLSSLEGSPVRPVEEAR